MVLLSVAGQADPAGHIHGVGSKLQLHSAFTVLKDLNGVGIPCGAGIHVTGHHSGDHVHGVHFVGFDVIHSQTGSIQGTRQSSLRGGTAVVGDLLALQIGDVINRGNLRGGQNDDTVSAVNGRGHEDVCLTVDAQLVSAMADVGQINAAAFHSRNFFRAGGELPQGDLQTFLREEALIHSGKNRPQGSIVGHVSNVQLDRLHRGSSGSSGFSRGGVSGGSSGSSGSGGACRCGRTAGSQAEHHYHNQQQGKQLFHIISS